MQERALSPIVRIVAGIIAAALLIISLLIAISQVRAGWGSDLRAWAAAVALLIVALLALRMLQAAWRGTIRVRGARGPDIQTGKRG
jgi:hypothetical protein